MFLSLLGSQLVELCELRVVVLLGSYFALIGMDIVSEIPISVATLPCQTVGVHGGVRGPGMNLHQWIILVHEFHPVAVFLEQLRKQRLVHSGAEGTLEIV